MCIYLICILDLVSIKLSMLTAMNSVIQVQVLANMYFMAVYLKNVPVNHKRGIMSI